PDQRDPKTGAEGPGLEPMNWEAYNETPLLVLLGLGLGKLEPESWWTWDRQTIQTPFASLKIMAGDESLFMHQFMQLYLGPTKIDDGHPDYYLNSLAATKFNK